MSLMKRLLASASIAAITVCGAVGPAMAQLSDPNAPVAVRDRPKPEYDAQGIRLGGFTARPSLAVEVVSNDNVFATSANEESDVITRAQPQLEIASNWSRHALRFNAGAEIFSYSDFDSEDRTNNTVGGEARLDVVRESFVGVRAARDVSFEPRTSPASVATASELPEIETTRVAVFGQHTFNRVRISAEAGERETDAGAVRTAQGGLISLDRRDVTESYLSGRVDVALTPDTAIVFQAGTNDRDFDQAATATVPSQDSEGSEVLVGVSTRLSRLVRGEIGAGFLEQSYDDPRVGDVEGLALRGAVDWYVTPITTVKLATERRASDIDIGVVTPVTFSNVDVRVDHELRRNVILTAGLGLATFDFETVDREDERRRVDVGADYLINRNAALRVGYTIEQGRSSGANADRDFDQNRLSLGLVFKL